MQGAFNASTHCSSERTSACVFQKAKLFLFTSSVNINSLMQFQISIGIKFILGVFEKKQRIMATNGDSDTSNTDDVLTLVCIACDSWANFEVADLPNFMAFATRFRG